MVGHATAVLRGGDRGIWTWCSEAFEWQSQSIVNGPIGGDRSDGFPPAGGCSKPNQERRVGSPTVSIVNSAAMTSWVLASTAKWGLTRQVRRRFSVPMRMPFARHETFKPVESMTISRGCLLPPRLIWTVRAANPATGAVRDGLEPPSPH